MTCFCSLGYNTMLDACTKAGDAPRGESWLQRMLEVGVQPNVISFATVIHAFARKGDERKAKHWQNKMLEMGVKPVIWRQVAVLTKKVGLLEEEVCRNQILIFDVFNLKDMQVIFRTRVGVPPCHTQSEDTVSYNSLIHACGVKGNILAAEGWLEDMLKHDLSVSVTTFASLIDACAKAGNLEKAEKWMEDLKWALSFPMTKTGLFKAEDDWLCLLLTSLQCLLHNLIDSN